MTTEVLRLDNIFKTYPGVTALSDVSFAVRVGEVHALVGENGAGKSTLMGVAAGVVQPDSGHVEIAGHQLAKHSPAAAQMAGLAVVYQHSMVLDDLTVAENLVFSLPEDRRPSYKETNAWVREHLAAVGADVSPKSRAEDLSIAQRQLVEIARALALQSKILILDEPTESLTANESEKLFVQIERLRASGTGIVYISHRFPEVQRIADRITVLRDGEVRGTFEASQVTENDILQLIVGRAFEHVFPKKATPSAGIDVLLETRNLTGIRFSATDLKVGKGEIVGLAGVEGNGQREFLRALAGLYSYQGEILVSGEQVDIHSPSEAARHGLVHLPGDRHVEGAFLPLTVRENISALVLKQLSRVGVVRRNAEVALAQQSIEDLRVRTPNIETPLASLSGGNQQKVLFARSLAANPIVLIADEPTRGVDVGARSEIYRLLRTYADEGHAVIVLSTDAIELAGLCDRVLVFSRGKIVRQLMGDNLSEREITGAAIAADEAREERVSSRSRYTNFGRLLRGDYFPSSILAALILILALWTAHKNSFFL
ncbi:MAG TPA: sugar ABC transporter ATP-binding protein, partial [Candidatus Nanopelagicaceae bacterium]